MPPGSAFNNYSAGPQNVANGDGPQSNMSGAGTQNNYFGRIGKRLIIGKRLLGGY